MTVMSRRTLLANLLPGAIAVAGVATVGLSLLPEEASAMPASGLKPDQVKPDDLIEKVQWHHPHHGGWRRGPRHRRWVCWWHRGRRICGWRW